MKYNTDLEQLKKETRIHRFGASTKGGQKANRTKSGIKLKHIPSGLEVKANKDRLQGRNLETAFQRLKKRLEKLNRPRRKRIPTKIPWWVKLKVLEEKKRHSRKKESRKRIKEGSEF
jgi:protein subunit release factor A